MFDKWRFLFGNDVLKERYELLCSSRKRYKRFKVQPVAVNHQWQMDLADLKYLERYNSGLRYLLVMIDVYSCYLWVKKLKNKSSELVRKKFDEILSDERKFGNTDVPPEHIQCDRGGEFAFLAKNDTFYGRKINLNFSSNYEMKAVIVERVIRTLKRMIGCVLYGVYGKDVGRYTMFLDMIVDRYNESGHSSLDGECLRDIYWGNIVLPLSFRYRGYFDFKPLMRRGSILKEEDEVRVSVMKGSFLKESRLNWSRSIYVVHFVRLTHPVTYRLVDNDGEIVSGLFYRQELQKVG